MTRHPSESRQQPAERPQDAPLAPQGANRAERARRQSQLLDEALEETFPASDPVSIAGID